MKGSLKHQISIIKTGEVLGKPVSPFTREMNTKLHKTRVQPTSAFRGLRNMLLSAWCRTTWFHGVRNFHGFHLGRAQASSKAPLSSAPVKGTALVLTSLRGSVTLFLKSGRCVRHEPGHLPARLSPTEAGVTVYRRGHHLQAAPLEKAKNSHLTKS